MNQQRHILGQIRWLVTTMLNFLAITAALSLDTHSFIPAEHSFTTITVRSAALSRDYRSLGGILLRFTFSQLSNP